MIQSIKKINVPVSIFTSDFISERKIMKSKYLKTEIHSIVAKYKIAKIRLLKADLLDKEERKKFENYTQKFDACLAALGKERQEIFKCGFMEDTFEWWKINYSMSQVYRIRRQCAIEFLKLFKE